MKTILVVDDDESIREAIKDLLEALCAGRRPEDELRVLTAEGGRRAVAMCTAEPPDLVLMDVNMPDLDGVEAFRRIRSARGGAPVRILFVTGYARDGIVRARIDQAIADGAVGCVLKPISAAELTDMLSRFVFRPPTEEPH